jgi:diguanylate cyclase (GGDEF)-like protein/PAS domain S-box-containing protein
MSQDLITRIKKQHLLEIYRWLVILCGVPVFFYSLYQLYHAGLNLNFLLLAAFTSLIATRISIKFPTFDGAITVSDAFIFVSLLMWGLPAAVLTTVVESVMLTYRMKSKFVRTYLFNIAGSTLTTCFAAAIVTYTFGNPLTLSERLPAFSFALAMCLLALSYFVGNMFFTTIMQMLKLNLSLWKTWAQYYLWTCVTFFFGAALAGAFIKLFDLGGFLAILLVTPILVLFYTAYQSYIRTVDALQASESRFRSSFDYATIGMGIVSKRGRWIQVNKSLGDILHFSEEHLLELSYRDIVHPDHLEEIEAKTEELIREELPAVQFETRLLNREGEDVWVMLGVSAANDSNGKLRHLIFQIQDITSRKRAEEKLWFDANHDALTGLPNRAAFLARLNELVTGRQIFENPMFAVLFLDLDGFKLINDSLGHAVGDRLLKSTAERLLQCIRGNDMVARLGGDEFTILLVNLQDISQAVTVAERIKGKLSRAFQLAGQEIFIGTSIGIASSETNYKCAGDILRDADAAMYQAKGQGKGRYSLFDQTINDQATKTLRLASDLRHAVERGEFEINYQPIYSLKKGTVAGFESLVRWNHPAYGTLPPGEFIPLAEENGIINRIDDWVLLNACRQMKEWHETFPACRELTISVNLSSKRFEKSGLFDSVKRVLIETGLPPERLQLEITETAMIKNLHNTSRILKELTLLGVKIALDDFGTGYSSLNYLHELPISLLKIDRSFVRRINGGEDGTEVLRAITALAESLKMRVIAEGIETDEQFSLLQKIECSFGQGYLFARPLNAAAAAELLENKSEPNAKFRPPLHQTALHLVSGG